MVWILKYAPEGYPERVKIIPRTFATKEEALATIPSREHVRRIENAFGNPKNYTGQVIWIVEPIGAIESAELVSKVKEVSNEPPPHFAS